MSRGWIVYILMFVIAAGGLWVILILGRAATAPDDLSGTWTVEWLTQPPLDSDPPPGAAQMHVSQSGRFFNVRFGDSEPIKMTLEPGWSGKRIGRHLKMKLNGGPWKLDVRGDIPGAERFRVPEVQLELAGPTRHLGIARRQREQTVEAEPPPPALPQPATQPITPSVDAETAYAR